MKTSEEVDANLIDDLVKAKLLLDKPYSIKTEYLRDTIRIPVVIIEASLLDRLLFFIEKEIN